LRINLKNILTCFGLVALALAAVASYAAAPAAGTRIVNQFTVEYNEAGTTRTGTSNTVVAEVLQIGSFTLDQDTTKTGTIGQTVSIQHRITNTGNGPDAFNLEQAPTTSDFTLLNVAIYPDLNNDGVADAGAQPITKTPTLAAGETYNFVVQATIPNSATTGQSSKLIIKGTSVFDDTVVKTNTDTITVSDFGIPTVVKSMSATSGLPGSTQTVRLAIVNDTLSSFNKVEVTDILPAGLEYVAGSARWSGSLSTALTDGWDSDELTSNGVSVDYRCTSSSTNVDFAVSNVPVGYNGYVEFQVKIANTASGTLQNTATYVVNNSVNANTNTVLFTVIPRIDFTVTGQTIASAPQGSVVTFTNSITNNSSIDDSYEITLNNNGFPAGTTYQLFKADGITPLADTNGNGTLNSDVIAAGATENFIVKVFLPTAVSGGTDWALILNVTSVANSSVTKPVSDILTTIAAASVSITDASGAKDNDNLLASQIISTIPGATVNYELKVANNSDISNVYNLGNTLTAAGYVVKYKDENNNYILNTGSIDANGYKLIKVEVTVPSDAIPSTNNFTVSVSSNVVGLGDSIKLRLIVNQNREVTISPNNVGTVFAGGNIIYTHVVTNNGTVTETDIKVTPTNTNSAFNSIVYVDANNDGVWDANDTQTDTIASLATGSNIHVFILVIANPSVLQGTTNVTLVTLSNTAGDLAGVLTATDTTTVTVNSIKLELYQKKDSDADYTTSVIQRKPGEQIDYKLVITNQNAIVVSTTSVNITVPAYTTPVNDIKMTRGADVMKSTTYNAPKTIELTDLEPGEIVELYYSLKVSE